ncbi:uncharacterized protein [Battus philenor]|uniref:uncharacterized protein n=1 Tax=Battus philenor TaxID=42288 RepID=UPI0035CF4BBB
MPRWMCGVTRLDKIRNKYFSGSLGVCDIVDKLQENPLRWYGHVKRSPEYIGNVTMDLNISASRRRGRPKTRWADTIVKDITAWKVPANDVSNRARWRKEMKKADPMIRCD